MKLGYNKKDSLLILESNNYKIGFSLDPDIRDLRKFFSFAKELFKKQGLDAIYGVPNTVDEVSKDQTRDLYLHRVKEFIKNNTFSSNMWGKTSPAEGVEVDIVALDKAMTLSAFLVMAEGIRIFILPKYNELKEGVLVPAEYPIVVGDGKLLSGISNIMDAKLIVLLSDVGSFSEKTGVADVQEKKTLTITANKLNNIQATEVVAL